MDSYVYLKFLAALVFVLGLIVLAAYVARRFSIGLPRAMNGGHERRLSISETLPLDARRRLMLIRRDDVEHLVILGASSETVVEQNIKRKDNS